MARRNQSQCIVQAGEVHLFRTAVASKFGCHGHCVGRGLSLG
jgi:hypothetical protein